jgi:predicted metalloprotease with PDZ domain
MIYYQIGSENPAGHYFDVTLTIQNPDPEGQIIRLPAWIPGSYMIRDFSRNIVEIHASDVSGELELKQLDKSSWQLPVLSAEVKVNYKVYAWDLSVRGAHLDTTHGFFNGSSVFLEVVGQSDNPCELNIRALAHGCCKSWKLATTLPRISGDEFGFGSFEAQNYQELIDHPVEMGNFEQLSFDACGLRHDVVLTGRFNCDFDRLKTDLTRICTQHITMFGAPAPMPRYLFLVMVVGEGYGGLEHKNSTSLMCTRYDLPQPGQTQASEEYRGFLGLCSHEYFHSWNVKRIRPQVFVNPDLTREVYTTSLWAFEGITSYYDDLALVRTGCISQQQYLELLGQTITRVQRGIGRKRQSAAASSFNAWHKFYKQDENSPNAIVSYYAKGSLIALCIDLKIRQLSEGKKSLDDVMRILWRDYLEKGAGVEDRQILSVVNQVVDGDLSELLDQMIYQTTELPLQELLRTVAVELSFRAASGLQDKGGKPADIVQGISLGALLKETDAGLQVVSVSENGAAQQAAVSAGDLIVAINGVKASMKWYQSWIAAATLDQQHQFVLFRRDELMHLQVKLQPPEQDTAVLSIIDPEADALKNWLCNAD